MKVLSIGWALFILALCSIPGHSVPQSALFTFDKLGHFGMFFIGALLWLRAWPDRAMRVFVAGLALSVGTELWQGLIPLIGRSADPLDVLADVVGLAVGLALAYWLQRKQRVPVA